MRKQIVFSWIFLLMSFLTVPVSASNIGLIENSTWQQNLTAVYYSSLSWGDIDNDTISDLILFGQSNEGDVAKIYINNGTSLVENQTWQQNLTAFRDGSSTLGDLDNDGDLDLVSGGCISGGGQITCNSNMIKVYTNNGTSFVENSTWENNLTSVDQSSLILGDVNNDGRLDLASMGYSTSGIIAKIYINNGTSLVENQTWQQNITGMYQGAFAWGDLDNDGDLDLVQTGDIGIEGKITKVYINNGTSLVENQTWYQNLLVVDRSSIVLGDYDNDGDLDLALIGQSSGDHLRFYLNNGTSLVESQGEDGGVLAGYFRGSIGWGDYDNDGDLDLAATGKETGRNWIYNNNDTVFEIDYTAGDGINTNNMQRGALSWVDLDNDIDLDLIASGVNDTGLLIKTYTNNITTPNTIPNPSINFTSSYTNGQLNLTWSSGSDTETPAAGLYYNLRVGTAPGGNDIVSGFFGGSTGGGGGGGPSAGYFGNMMQRKSILLNVLLSPGQTIYWSVQTIDTGLAKSSWSSEQNYTIQSDSTTPTITVNSPSNQYNTSDTTVVFNATVYDLVNLTNVSLWGSWGGWHINETNSSGINSTDYVFTKNLTGYGDGDYTWQIGAYDNSSNYQSSSIRTLTIDTASPVIILLSPSATWTSSNTITFTYNVSDIRIANCSLIISGATDQTNSTVTVDAAQAFTKFMPNGNYVWSVNCTDTVGHTGTSGESVLTVSYVTLPSGGGGIIVSSGGTEDRTNQSNTTAEGNETLSSIEVGETVTAIIEKEGVSQVTVSVRNHVENVSVDVEGVPSLPPSIPELNNAYKYLMISKSVSDEDIESIAITFSVDRSWILDNDINESTVALNRYTDKWDRLETVKLSETGEELVFEAHSPGLSYFAITGEVSVVPETRQDGWTILIAAVVLTATLFALGELYPRIKKANQDKHKLY